MSREKSVLITGAAGEMGHALIGHFSKLPGYFVVAVDVAEDPGYDPRLVRYLKADIRDDALFSLLLEKYDIAEIFHLAALLSTGGERSPIRAHEVNIDGSLGILTLAREQALRRGAATKVLFPSTIAVYGIPSLELKQQAGRVNEDQYLDPITMYGINKLYVEKLGRYFDRHFRYLEREENEDTVDFRAIRFPGILSSETVPTGGTSDYGPEMLHAAAQGKNYECFVEPSTMIPFMVMPDAVRALLALSQAAPEMLSTHVYNVAAFAPSAAKIAAEILRHFPDFEVSYKPHPRRLSICNSWPMDTDDSKARADWNWSADYDFDRAFAEYLVPAVRARYATKKKAVGW